MTSLCDGRSFLSFPYPDRHHAHYPFRRASALSASIGPPHILAAQPTSSEMQQWQHANEIASCQD